MTQPIERDVIYRRRRFPREVIEGCVRWYLTYRLSYRDLVALMGEWGVHVSYTSIMRWVYRYVLEYERRWSRRAKPVGSSWRVDETYIQTRPKTGYLRSRVHPVSGFIANARMYWVTTVPSTRRGRRSARCSPSSKIIALSRAGAGRCLASSLADGCAYLVGSGARASDPQAPV